ncbi:hypothetical protein O6H91_01G072700 [Diphasiastrum complanatum]|uniref:Uncharacterized protein n=1 Tax=Diphasiastrum complanatum TaxID=34168 RepID=A0ACC2ES79_DIPCM|nr:hypothetical protein O6H91_01G072700 [Diphasiastrum complanatum]
MVEMQSDGFVFFRSKDASDSRRHWPKLDRKETIEKSEPISKERNTADDQNEGRDKDTGAWSAHATSELIRAFQEKRMAKKRVDIDWRIFRSEDWDAVADRINDRCGMVCPKDRKIGKQCQYKIGNLKRRFKSESVKGEDSDWRWFSPMEEIFAGELVVGGKPPTHDGDELEGRQPPTTDCHPSLVQTCDPNRAGEDGLDEPTSCSMPTSKSASTTDVDRCSPGMNQYIGMAAVSDSGPSSPHGKLLTSMVSSDIHNRKRSSSSEASPSDAFAGSISKSMKMMAMQQGEMIQLMRKMVESQTSRSHTKVKAAEDSMLKKDVLHVRKKMEAVERDLVKLKEICEQKEEELRDVLQLYNEKQDLRNALYNQLMEIVSASDNIPRHNDM